MLYYVTNDMIFRSLVGENTISLEHGFHGSDGLVPSYVRVVVGHDG